MSMLYTTHDLCQKLIVYLDIYYSGAIQIVAAKIHAY